MIHLTGVGDLRLAGVTALEDPCPLPSHQKAKRSLNEKEAMIYAPFSGLGGVLYDKDAVYIETGGAQSFAKGVSLVLVLIMLRKKCPTWVLIGLN